MLDEHDDPFPDLVRIHMAEAIAKYNLMVQQDGPWTHLTKSGVCKLSFYKEIGYIAFTFGPAGSYPATFYPGIYMDIVYGRGTVKFPNNSEPNPNWKIDTLKFYNDLVVNYFEPPMNGDFSFAEKHDTLQREISKLNDYIHLDKPNKAIQEKKRIGDPSWEEDARAWYKEQTGNELSI